MDTHIESDRRRTYRYTNEPAAYPFFRSGPILANSREEALVLAQAETIRSGGRWQSVKIAPREEKFCKPEHGKGYLNIYLLNSGRLHPGGLYRSFEEAVQTGKPDMFTIGEVTWRRLND